MQDAVCLVSVIIPVYNVEKYLHACVDSAIMQTYDNLEIILVDDGSTDNSADICDNYCEMDSRVRAIHCKNGGSSEARNTGIAASHGKYIYFLDSDDWIRGDTIEVLVNIAERNDCEIVMFDAFVVNESGIELDDARYISKFDYPVLSGSEMFNMMWDNNEYSPVIWNFIFSRDLIINAKLSFISGILYEDGPFAFSLLMKAKSVCHIKEQLYFRRIREGSIIHSPVTVKNVESYLTVMRDIYNTFLRCGNETIYENIQLNLRQYFGRLVNCFISLSESEKIKVKKILEDAISFLDDFVILKPIDIDKMKHYNHMIWYGGGKRCRILLNQLNGIVPDEIWDINAEQIGKLSGIPVVNPYYQGLRNRSNCLLVVCVDDLKALEHVTTLCSPNEFHDVCDWQYYLAVKNIDI